MPSQTATTRDRRTYWRDWKRARRRPDSTPIPPYVPAGPVRRYLNELSTLGINDRQVVSSVDASLRTVWEIRTGRRRYITRRIRDALLAYTPPHPTADTNTSQDHDGSIETLYDTLTHILEDRAAAWRQHAACRTVPTEIFFPSRGEDTSPAHATCRRCPVTRECLDYALEHAEQTGIWGDTPPKPRRHLRRTREAP